MTDDPLRQIPASEVHMRIVHPPTVETDLPSPFPSHQHATQECHDIALRHTILRAQVGSGVHGTAVAGHDDRDEMGICLEPPAYVTGLRRFEMFERHTAWDRERGMHERSGAGDLDVVIYSARKWARLALAGNPTVLMLLFVPDSELVVCTPAGDELRRHASRFLSRKVAFRFMGYLNAQRGGMQGIGHTNRPELVAQYGYDTKFAMHAVRLGLQGVQLMRTGTIPLPIPEPDLSVLRSIRLGEVDKDTVLNLIDDLDAELRWFSHENALPDEPDHAWVDSWLHRSYLEHWGHEPIGASSIWNQD